MQQAKILLHHPSGLHARPAAQFAKLAQSFKSNITVSGNGEAVSAKSILQILTLDITKDDEIVITAEGEDEQEAIISLVRLVQDNFPV